MTYTKKTADERAAEAIANEPDPTDRDAIARAAGKVSYEIVRTKGDIARAAADVTRDSGMPALKAAVARLERLVARQYDLHVRATEALRAQVDADPDMAGTVVHDDGRITFPPAAAAKFLTEGL